MPKFSVTVLETTTLDFEIEAVNADEAEKLSYDMDRTLAKASEPTREVSASSRKLEPNEIALKMQIDNIRADYERLKVEGTLPSGEEVDEASGITILEHLATLHNNLVTQSGLDLPPLGAGDSIVEKHIGEADPTPIQITEDPQVIWERAAAKLGWHWDADYKGWIKPSNKKPGAVHGEWDAYVRDQEAEDACNEEGIDTLEEAMAVILGRPIPEGSEH
jgi:hypothetical protein